MKLNKQLQHLYNFDSIQKKMYKIKYFYTILLSPNTKV